MENSLDKIARAHADQYCSELIEYLRGDERTKRRITEKWLDEELTKPRPCAEIIGLESYPDAV